VSHDGHLRYGGRGRARNAWGTGWQRHHPPLTGPAAGEGRGGPPAHRPPTHPPAPPPGELVRNRRPPPPPSPRRPPRRPPPPPPGTDRGRKVGVPFTGGFPEVKYPTAVHRPGPRPGTVRITELYPRLPSVALAGYVARRAASHSKFLTSMNRYS